MGQKSQVLTYHQKIPALLSFILHARFINSRTQSSNSHARFINSQAWFGNLYAFFFFVFLFILYDPWKFSYLLDITDFGVKTAMQQLSKEKRLLYKSEVYLQCICHEYEHRQY